MPCLFKYMGYLIYFWSNEGAPVEPIHVHVSDGEPRCDAPKVWLLKIERYC